MTIDERIEALTSNLETLHSSVKELRAVAESHAVNIESLHSTASELHANSQRHDELLQLLARDTKADGEHIRAIADHIQRLVRIAEIHEQRLTNLEGPEKTGA